MSDNKIELSCIDCASGSCDAKGGLFPDFCQSRNLDQKLLKEAMDIYIEDQDTYAIMEAAAEVECENYCKMTRIEEIAEFAHKINARKLGIATCVGLLGEARTAAKILRHKGFEVFGVACKIGTQTKTSIGLDEKHNEIGLNMCNPVLQAKLLNSKETDLNIVVGLCVGHDSLFYKHSDALCTTLVTKDRVLGHNPAAALYQANTYYSKLLK